MLCSDKPSRIRFVPILLVHAIDGFTHFPARPSDHAFAYMATSNCSHSRSMHLSAQIIGPATHLACSAQALYTLKPAVARHAHEHECQQLLQCRRPPVVDGPSCVSRGELAVLRGGIFLHWRDRGAMVMLASRTGPTSNATRIFQLAQNHRAVCGRAPCRCRSGFLPVHAHADARLSTPIEASKRRLAAASRASLALPSNSAHGLALAARCASAAARGTCCATVGGSIVTSASRFGAAAAAPAPCSAACGRVRRGVPADVPRPIQRI